MAGQPGAGDFAQSVTLVIKATQYDNPDRSVGIFDSCFEGICLICGRTILFIACKVYIELYSMTSGTQ